MLMPVTATNGSAKVMSKSCVNAVPIACPFAMVPVTEQVPAAVADNELPVIDAPAVPASLTDQTISLKLALAGVTAAPVFSSSGVPTVPDREAVVLVMPVTAVISKDGIEMEKSCV